MFRRMVIGVMALAAVISAMSALAVIHTEYDEDDTFYLPEIYRIPTWCIWVRVVNENEYLDVDHDRYGCGDPQDPWEFDWVLVGFTGVGRSEDTDSDGIGNALDICPTMSSGADGAVSHGCPWIYIEELMLASVLVDVMDTDGDGVRDWFDVCDGQQGTTNTLGCDRDAPPPSDLCQALGEPARGVIKRRNPLTEEELPRENWYYLYHGPDQTGPVYGMGPRARDIVVAACDAGEWDDDPTP